jgi:chromosome segregation ATPase
MKKVEKQLQEYSAAVPRLLEKHTIELRNQIRNNAKDHAEQLTQLRDYIIDTENTHKNELTEKDTEIETRKLEAETAKKEKEKLMEDGEKALADKETEKQALEAKLTENKDELEQKQNQLDKANQEKSKLEKRINDLKSEKQVITNNYNQVAKKCQEYERIAAETAERINNQTLLPDPKDLDLHK